MDTNASYVWAQEFVVATPSSWRFTRGREAILERFRPSRFVMRPDFLAFRFGKAADLYLSEDSVSIRLLSPQPMNKIAEDLLPCILDELHIAHLHSVQSSFSLFGNVDLSYDQARNVAINTFLSGPFSRLASDFALTVDLNSSDELTGKLQLGVVENEELLVAIASATSSDPSSLLEDAPAWMRVRMPLVGLYLQWRGMTSGDSVTSAVEGKLVDTVFTLTKGHREQAEKLFAELYAQFLVGTSGGNRGV